MPSSLSELTAYYIQYGVKSLRHRGLHLLITNVGYFIRSHERAIKNFTTVVNFLGYKIHEIYTYITQCSVQNSHLLSHFALYKQNYVLLCHV